jgi:tight adherence protein B
MTSAEQFDRTAGIVHRLAVLLAAGVPPANAWGYLDVPPGTPGAHIAQDIADGASVAEAIATAAGLARTHEREAWNALAVAWAVATVSGAPLAPTLQRMASTLRDLGQTSREIGVALAGPAATRRLVLWLPAIGVLFGIGLGFDPLRVLLLTPPGWLFAGAGLGLLLLARAWTARLVAAAQPAGAVPGLDLDLLAIAVSGGGSIDRALDIVREHAGVDPGGAAARVLQLAGRAGVPAADLLRAEADQARREHLATAQIRVARLGVTLLLPLGICVLPAFLALGVAPLLLSVLTQTMGRF